MSDNTASGLGTSERTLRAITKGLDEYDATTIRYLHAQGVSEALILRVRAGMRVSR